MKQANQHITRVPSTSPLWDSAKSYKNSKGYIVLIVYDPQTKKMCFRMEHIVIYERAHGTEIPGTHCIHHMNGITDDNRVENLFSIPKNLHMRMHKKLRQLSQNLAPVFFNVKRHAIIQEYVDIAKAHMERKVRWGIVPITA